MNIKLLILCLISLYSIYKSKLIKPTYNFGNKQNYHIDLLYNHLLGNNLYFFVNTSGSLTSQFSITLYPSLSLIIKFKIYTSDTQLINALERVSVMVNERTNIIKFTFKNDSLTLKADTPETGASEDVISIEFSDSEELIIAFNYKYVLDSLKIMESKNVKIGLGGSLSATIFRPDSEDDYLCLIMPIQIR